MLFYGLKLTILIIHQKNFPNYKQNYGTNIYISLNYQMLV